MITTPAPASEIDRCTADASLLASLPLSKALNYARARVGNLRVFLGDPDVPIDTNHLERGLRPIPMGKNYPQLVVMEGCS